MGLQREKTFLPNYIRTHMYVCNAIKVRKKKVKRYFQIMKFRKIIKRQVGKKAGRFEN